MSIARTWSKNALRSQVDDDEHGRGGHPLELLALHAVRAPVADGERGHRADRGEREEQEAEEQEQLEEVSERAPDAERVVDPRVVLERPRGEGVAEHEQGDRQRRRARRPGASAAWAAGRRGTARAAG